MQKERERKTLYLDEKAALAILFVWILLAVCVPLFGPYSPTDQNVQIRNESFSGAHLFGTDEFGRDNFTRVWYGAGISLVIGLGSALLNGMIGILYGAAAGYCGKRIDCCHPVGFVCDIDYTCYGRGGTEYDTWTLYCRMD